MKIFTGNNGGWSSKINFVDQNNVVLGYDMEQCCCENADWLISDTWEYSDASDISGTFLPEEDDKGVVHLDDWYFDTSFFEGGDEPELDAGGWASFKITDGLYVKYIIIYNSHNGYYGHGFEFMAGDDIITNGGL